MGNLMGAEGEEGSEPQDFRFRAVLWDGVEATFGAMSGLDGGSEFITLRPGEPPVFRPRTSLGAGKAGRVMLRRGIFDNDAPFRAWYDRVVTDTAPRGTVVIRMVDERDRTRMMWTLNRARPAQIRATDTGGDSGEVAVESLDIAYETIVVTPP